MKEVTFESKLLSDGHLYCPEELLNRKNARFKATAYFEDGDEAATERDIESSAIEDVSEDFLSEKELDYYLNLDEQ